AGNIPKPAFQAFQMLHKLGDQRVALDSDSALLTKRSDGALVLALWNYVAPEENDAAKSFTLQIKNKNVRQASIWRLDTDHGDVLREYQRLGSPDYPTKLELEKLRAVTKNAQAETVKINSNQLTLNVPAKGLLIIEVH